jgi:hypothetical protein
MQLESTVDDYLTGLGSTRRSGALAGSVTSESAEQQQVGKPAFAAFAAFTSPAPFGSHKFMRKAASSPSWMAASPPMFASLSPGPGLSSSLQQQQPPLKRTASEMQTGHRAADDEFAASAF